MMKRIMRLAALKRVMQCAYLLPGINTRVRPTLDPLLPPWTVLTMTPEGLVEEVPIPRVEGYLPMPQSDGPVSLVPFLDLNVAASHIAIFTWKLHVLFVVWY